MRLNLRSLLPFLMLSATLFLAACESSEEKAERYFQSGLSLLEAGDTDRALVEFRNVFKYNGFHKEARRAYADIQFQRGEEIEAYGQYLRLIEQYPDTVEVRQILAEIATRRGDWNEAERHGRAAIALTPDADDVPAIAAIAAALDYRAAVVAKDTAGRAAAVERAKKILTLLPESLIVRRIVIDSLVSGPNPLDALPQIDLALKVEPDSLEFHVLKFRLLALAEDLQGTGAQLRTMFELFPDNQDVRAALISWYLLQNDVDGAEAFLRQLAGADTAAVEGHVAVVQLLQAARGSDAAAAELERLAEANKGQPNADLYRALRATIDFDTGQQAEALAEFEDILKSAEASDQTRRIKVMLAQILIATGNQVGARARIEEVLAEDTTNVEALKLRAAWLIDEDKPGDAILDLRGAFSQDPRDAETLTLMARAHEREGSLELAGERLSQAVEVSGAAAEESLRYARFLMRQGRSNVAESILVDARKVSPAHVGVLTLLADLLLADRAWSRVQDLADTLRQIETPEAQQAALSVQAALMLGQGRAEDSLAFLQSQAGAGDTNINSVVQIVQTQIRLGKVEEARRYLDDILAETPDDAGLRMLSASLFALTGQMDDAEQIFRDLIAEDPASEPPVRMLYGLLRSSGRPEEATRMMEAALTAQPTSTTLRWIKAGELEQASDFEGAIGVYEELYAEDSSNVVVANNLASLITTHRDDAASLERAYAVARRLRGMEVPAFQDTYGWIAYRRGDLTEALASLEPAAAGLPNDPLVQFHLGMTYAGLERTEDALRVLGRALELAGDSPLPQFQAARETLAELGKASE